MGAELVADEVRPGRTIGAHDTAERAAAVLREHVAQGLLRPGVRLSEERIGRALGVSRNTLRESFRLLTHERLLIHRLNRGTFVRVLDVSDIQDIYQVRRLVECAALRDLGAGPYQLTDVRAAVTAAERAAQAHDWQRLGTANIHFHQALAGLAASPRGDDMMRGVLAELRLAFHVMDEPRQFHEPYLPRNQDILRTLEAGAGETAARLLSDYLDDSRQQLVDAYPKQPAHATP
ncbi:GntR family transcriptional regulator [Streptomyces oceani]|uniref:GntR family transcriptional regulator n=1 Tax=Streptomyces oceani TaxID=1075402 RepID=A0A1E7JZM5_9ACTN|nr:GntR family transcriptional regulator [Streptomyces oceani]